MSSLGPVLPRPQPGAVTDVIRRDRPPLSKMGAFSGDKAFPDAVLFASGTVGEHGGGEGDFA